MERRADRQTWQIETVAAERLVFPTAFFPGWRAAVDGEPRALVALDGLGLLALDLPAGAHLVELRLGQTPIRWATEVASLVGGVVWLSLAVWWAAGSRRRLTALGAGLALVGASLGWLALRPVTPPAPAPLSGPLVMDLASYPYLHHEPEGLRLGEALLADYSFGTDTLSPGDALVIDLEWAQLAPQQTLQVRLLPLTGHIMDQSVVWAEANAPIDAAQMRLVLALPATMPPGVYVPRLGVKLDEATLPIETARGAPQSRASLAPVWVSRAAPRTQAGEPLAVYGLPQQSPLLALLSVTTTPIKDKQVEVRLSWRAEGVSTRNYALSLRHLDGGGAEQDAVDLAPMSPDYPTGLWRRGEAVEVRVLASEGRDAFAAGDAWRIVLYDRLTLAEIGSADVPVVFAD